MLTPDECDDVFWRAVAGPFSPVKPFSATESILPPVTETETLYAAPMSRYRVVTCSACEADCLARSSDKDQVDAGRYTVVCFDCAGPATKRAPGRTREIVREGTE